MVDTAATGSASTSTTTGYASAVDVGDGADRQARVLARLGRAA